MVVTIDKTIGEMVAEDYRTAAVFKKHHIDFCCNGNRSLEEACKSEKLNAEQISAELEEIPADGQMNSTTDFQSWPSDLLADYVEKKHHRYVEQQIPVLKGYLQKIVQAHGEKHPELEKIQEYFNASAGELATHMKKEELVLFPLIRKLVAAGNSGKSMERSVAGPIEKMMQEHDNEGERFRKIAKLSDNYAPPADACNTYKVTFGLLREFEEDLHLHIHLENNILFPNSIKLENELSN